MDQENKLLKFKNAVFEEIDFKIARMKEDSISLDNKLFEENVDRQLIKAYNEIQAKIGEIKRNAKRSIARFSLDSKRELLKKREELTNSVFDTVLNRLDEYIKTDEYKEKLILKIGSFTKSQAIQSGSLIFVSENDFSFAEDIKKACFVPCEVLKDSSVSHGGFIVKDEKSRTYFDETLKAKLYEQKPYFIENCEFGI